MEVASGRLSCRIRAQTDLHPKLRRKTIAHGSATRCARLRTRECHRSVARFGPSKFFRARLRRYFQALRAM
jgi:hypothetical protein